MKNELLKDILNIRNFETSLLELFPKGLLKGTTHTSLGQESNATGIIKSLEENDVVVSNHRCHGHYLAHTNDYKGLLNEILGKDNGVCGGLGGSQHLCYKNKFFSNGILGGNVGMATGISFSMKFKKIKNIVCLFVGDGTLGQGIFYESLNIIGKNKLPILIVVEDNEISQSTKTQEVLPGKIFDKIKSFEINTLELFYPDVFELNNLSKKIIKNIKEQQQPHCLIIKSNRLGPHSKGDDTRSDAEITKLKNNDTLLKSIKKLDDFKLVNQLKKQSEDFINKIFNDCLNEKNVNKKLDFKSNKTENHKFSDTRKILSKIENKRFSENINHTLNELFKKDKNLFLIGEDLLDPYGGAFKISKNLSTKYKDRVYSSPISEAGIIGLATGMAIYGLKPIVEIMFGDFLTLGFDQLLNNACKFRKMYNNQVKVPLVIRTPMGGRRGYGPTHSQSIEKYFFGIDGLNIIAINPFQNLEAIYDKAINESDPTLIIENKIDYNFIPKNLNTDNKKYNDFNVRNYSDEEFNVSFSLTNFEDEEGTIICYGGMLSHSLNAAKKIFIEEEISYRVVSIGKIHPMNFKTLKENITDSGNIVCVEESTADYGFGSEICYNLMHTKQFNQVLKIGSISSLIPSSFIKEKSILLDDEKIFNYLKEII